MWAGRRVYHYAHVIIHSQEIHVFSRRNMMPRGSGYTPLQKPFIFDTMQQTDTLVQLHSSLHVQNVHVLVWFVRTLLVGTENSADEKPITNT